MSRELLNEMRELYERVRATLELAAPVLQMRALSLPPFEETRLYKTYTASEENTAIPMRLWCPACGASHVDRATESWSNPPHRSHLCEVCGCIWRPADVPTVGVEEIATSGKNDTAFVSKEAPSVKIVETPMDDAYEAQQRLYAEVSDALLQFRDKWSAAATKRAIAGDEPFDPDRHRMVHWRDDPVRCKEILARLIKHDAEYDAQAVAMVEAPTPSEHNPDDAVYRKATGVFRTPGFEGVPCQVVTVRGAGIAGDPYVSDHPDYYMDGSSLRLRATPNSVTTFYEEPYDVGGTPDGLTEEERRHYLAMARSL